MADAEAEACATLARALLAQHSLGEAERGRDADRLAARSREPEVKITVALAKASLAEKVKPEGGPPYPAGTGGGVGSAVALDVRLALLELEAAHATAGTPRSLADLEKDARSHGFVQVIDCAARAAAGGRQAGGWIGSRQRPPARTVVRHRLELAARRPSIE